MTRTPDGSVLILPGSKGRSLLLATGGAVFVVIGTWVAIGWLWIGFFGLCAMIGAAYLHLCPEGFVVCSLFRKSPMVLWADAHAFRVARVPLSQGKRMVVFDSSNSTRPRLARMNAALVGATGALPESYGLQLDALADLMNEWRARHAPIDV